MSVQPTDLGRLAAVVFLAWWLKRNPPAERGFVRGLLPPLAIVGLVAALVLLQPNLSSAVLLLATGLVVLYLAEAPLAHLAVPVGAGLVTVAAMLQLHPYQMQRVATYVRFVLTGALDQRGSGWQLDQSLIAIGSGGWFGAASAEGPQKYLFLPEAHTDFISPSSLRNWGSSAPRPARAAGAATVARHARRGARHRPVPLRCSPVGSPSRSDCTPIMNLSRGHRARPDHRPAAPVRLVRGYGAARQPGGGRPAVPHERDGDESADALTRERWARGRREGADRGWRHRRTRLPRHRRGRGAGAGAFPRRRSVFVGTRRGIEAQAGARGRLPHRLHPVRGTAAARVVALAGRACCDNLIGLVQALAAGPRAAGRRAGHRRRRERPGGAGRGAAPSRRAAGAEQRAGPAEPLARPDRGRGAPGVRRVAPRLRRTRPPEDHRQPDAGVHPERRPRPPHLQDFRSRPADRPCSCSAAAAAPTASTRRPSTRCGA